MLRHYVLYADSCDSAHVIKAIPRGQCIRARWNCSTLKGFKGNWPLRRDYLNGGIKKLGKLKKEILREDIFGQWHLQKGQNVWKKKQPVVFSTGFSLEYNEIKWIVHGYLSILLADPEYIVIFFQGFRFVVKILTIGNILSPRHFQSKKHSNTWLAEWSRHGSHLYGW